MKKIIISTLTCLFLLLSGCASVSMTSLEADRQAKEFMVASDKSNIYLYRNEMFGGAIAMPVSLDGKMAGRTGPETYFLWEVEPGAHEVISHTENEARLRLTTEAGKNYFIWQEVKMGMWTARSQLHEVSEEEGRAGVLECKRADSDI
ncbi:DUF2846 domain-containing protein [Marinobacterium mangrovicola]|uniref:Uncharacterized protein DUF2846 n=1 Tax=Marinobacterium mangrovicola TaxID=1476959 RepID=A0A4R1GS45_9GAMM|nr:DUF2846 domain-containing protein [Marinobacterium mangrovicola]TCK07402.1 uncharacterized protein DUF2846 [Marinobacterium mangrovicola]